MGGEELKPASGGVIFSLGDPVGRLSLTLSSYPGIVSEAEPVTKERTIHEPTLAEALILTIFDLYRIDSPGELPEQGKGI